MTAANHLGVQADDLPPPPYTETDIYSNSGASDGRSPVPHRGNLASSQTLGSADDGVSSSTGDLVYTPPETPIISGPPRPATPNSLYFESRPPPARLVTPSVGDVYKIDVRPNLSPDDVPYKPDWAAREVTAQDWATFVNFLLPDHALKNNQTIIDRKLQAEAAASLSHASGSGGLSPAESHLESLRSSGISPDEAIDGRQSRAEMKKVVRKWNASFFEPRGVAVQIVPIFRGPDHRRVPGAWDAGTPDNDQDSSAELRPTQSQPKSSYTSRLNKTFGRFTVDDQGVKFGERFAATSDGLRIGGLVMDHRGIRLQGQGSGNGGNFHNDGTRTSSLPRNMQPPPGPWHGFGPQSMRSIGPDLDRGGARGRDLPRQEAGIRQRSASRDSIASTSSAESDSTIGSLPDYDEVRKEQLPLYVSRLEVWLSQPEKAWSKSDVQQLKCDLKADRQATQPSPEDVRRLRAQVKALRLQWREVKRQQKRERRDRKRERRQARRLQKRERRDARRASNRAERGRGPEQFGQRGPPTPPLLDVPFLPNIGPAHTGQSNGLTGYPSPSHKAHSPHISSGCGRSFSGQFPKQPSWPSPGSGPPGPRADRPWQEKTGVPPRRPVPRRATPGSWPEEDTGPTTANNGPKSKTLAGPTPGGISAEKYRAAAAVEKDIADKVAAASKLKAKSPGRTAADREIEALADYLAALRTEADEAFARELDAEEVRATRGS